MPHKLRGGRGRPRDSLRSFLRTAGTAFPLKPVLMLRVSTTGVTSQGYSFLKVAKATGSDIAATPPFIPVAATSPAPPAVPILAPCINSHSSDRQSDLRLCGLGCDAIELGRVPSLQVLLR